MQVMRVGRFAAVIAAAMLGSSLAGCGQRHIPPEPKKSAPTPYRSLEQVPEKLSPDGTTITVGDPDATVTVHLYEDPRCPYCEDFETTGGASELREATKRRETKTQYTMASFLDNRVGGTGSKKAVNALRAALEVGKFAEYHDVLYANQPDESVDGYTDAYLLKLADQVDGLRSPAFDSAVRKLKYRTFVTDSQKAYERAGGKEDPEGPGTPTAVINDVRIPLESNSMLYDAAVFGQFLRLIHDKPQEWKDLDL